MLTSDRVFKNKKLFQLLGLRSESEIQFKTKLPISILDLHEYNYKNKRHEAIDFNLDNFLRFISNYHVSIYEKLAASVDASNNAYRAYTNCCRYLSGYIDPECDSIPKEDLVYLLDIGLINASDIKFTTIKKELIKISDLSSGQKCMILTLLNISGSIADNSVVCIDEPEISLHPKWQKEFIKVLIEFFSEFKRCHFIIATHSPLIISELSSENCFILNMDLGYANKACDYGSMSSDYQLAEVFGVAGNNNEYLNRVVVSLLSKLSVSGKLDKSERVKLDSLVALSKEMSSHDNVKQLIDILNLAWKRVSGNAK